MFIVQGTKFVEMESVSLPQVEEVVVVVLEEGVTVVLINSAATTNAIQNALLVDNALMITNVKAIVATVMPKNALILIGVVKVLIAFLQLQLILVMEFIAMELMKYARMVFVSINVAKRLRIVLMGFIVTILIRRLIIIITGVGHPRIVAPVKNNVD